VRNIDNFEYVLDRFLTIKSYPFMDYLGHYDQFVADMVGWRNAGKLVFREQHYAGLEQAPQALIDLLAGRTSGKPLVFLGDGDGA
jgi:NADPH-dependent curcumin reductase CurA